MGLTPNQIAELIKLRALGWSQKEIAEALGTSQQVIAYQLKKLKLASLKDGVDDVFQKALMPFLVGAGMGMMAFAFLQEMNKSSRKGGKK